MTYLLYFIFGGYLASFLGLVISRFPEKKLFRPASYCDHCQKRLALRDKIPIFSQLFNRLHCRFCKAKISYFYLFFEVALACLFLLVASSLLSVPQALLLCMGATLAIYDQRELSYPLLVWLVFHLLILGLTDYQPSMLFFLLLGLITALVNVGIGAGDFLFLASCALLFDLSELLIIIQIASLAGLACFYWKKQKDRLAFVPCLFFAVLLLISYKLLLLG